MNPQEAQSLGTSALLYALGVAATALVTKGIMTQDQANALVPEIGTALVGIASVAVFWWKKNQHSPVAVAAAVASTPAVASAVIDTINTDAMPEVKVVSNTSVSPAVAMTKTGKVVSAHERP